MILSAIRRLFRKPPSPQPLGIKVYLAGKMTGLPNMGFPAFHAAAKSLRASGYEVVNPAEINPDPDAKWEDCMRADIAQLVTCDAVAMLPGWETSKGACIEHRLALDLGMRAIYLQWFGGAE